jgi:hypothetical protein
MIYHVRFTPFRAMRAWSISTDSEARNEEKIVQWSLAQFREGLLGERLNALEIQKI